MKIRIYAAPAVKGLIMHSPYSVSSFTRLTGVLEGLRMGGGLGNSGLSGYTSLEEQIGALSCTTGARIGVVGAGEGVLGRVLVMGTGSMPGDRDLSSMSSPLSPPPPSDPCVTPSDVAPLSKDCETNSVSFSIPQREDSV